MAVGSIAISFSITLATTHIESLRTFCVFVIVTVIGYLAALAFGLLWWRSRRAVRNVAQAIRSRIPPEGVQQTIEGSESSS